MKAVTLQYEFYMKSLENKEAIIEALYAKLQHLPTASNKFSDIKYTYNVIEKLLRQLESQGEIDSSAS